MRCGASVRSSKLWLLLDPFKALNVSGAACGDAENHTEMVVIVEILCPIGELEE